MTQRNPEGAEPRTSTDTMVEDVAEALRCTDHIRDRTIRAKYIVQTLKIDGYEIEGERETALPEPSSLDAPCRHQYPHDGPCEAALPEPSLDVERLAEAMMEALTPGYRSGPGSKGYQKLHRQRAERIAAEYTRLASEKGTGG